jgi:hypothetical protein
VRTALLVLAALIVACTIIQIGDEGSAEPKFGGAPRSIVIGGAPLPASAPASNAQGK